MDNPFKKQNVKMVAMTKAKAKADMRRLIEFFKAQSTDPVEAMLISALFVGMIAKEMGIDHHGVEIQTVICLGATLANGQTEHEPSDFDKAKAGEVSESFLAKLMREAKDAAARGEKPN